VLATFRSSRNSCIGLLVNSIRAKSRRMDNSIKRNPSIDTLRVSIDGFLLFELTLACLVRVRAPSQARVNSNKRKQGVGLKDDSGSKLRDKEQQRLSSK